MRKKILLCFALLLALCVSWTQVKAQQSDTRNYLHFVSLKEDCSLRLDKVSYPDAVNLEYSKDNRQTWTNYAWNDMTGASVAFAHAGDTIWFRAGQNGTAGTNATFSIEHSTNYQFVFGANDSIAAGGNIMSLYDGTCQQDTLTAYAFYELFKDCKGLTAAPELPATQLAEGCYVSMFEGCTSLTAAPSLPATQLAEGCYLKMFLGCTSLSAAPALLATQLTSACYETMFSGCTSLAAAPSLLATQLAEFCYNNMFNGCTSLKVDTCAGSCDGALLVVPAAANSYWYWNMFSGCQGPYAGNIRLGGRYCITEYVAPPDTLNYLHFVSLKEGCTLRLDKKGSFASQLNAQLEYSTDNRQTWSSYRWTTTTGPSVAFAHAGDTVWFRAGQNGTAGTNATFSQYDNRFYQFVFGATDSIAAGGNIMSLYDGSCQQTTMTRYGFCCLFKDCKGLTTAPSLPATQLAECCYSYMFNRCTSLSAAPALPATQLAQRCYDRMFNGCTSLSAAPALPATQLQNECYHSMFQGCTSLSAAPSLQATQLAQSCYGSMFSGCTSLAAAPQLPANTLQQSCYSSMFSRCTSLTAAPELRADTLAQSCYRNMFDGCTSLSAAPALPATQLQNECYHSMFQGCTSLSAAPSLQATQLAQSCYGSMFSGCTSLSAAPSLPATQLAQSCYREMFNRCTSLLAAPQLPATQLQLACYQSMFAGCTSLSAAPALRADTLAKQCYYTMFAGCTSLKVDTCAGSCDGALLVVPTASAQFWNDGMFASCHGPYAGNIQLGGRYCITELSFTVTLNVNDTTMGTVTGAGTYHVGEVATLIATPAPHHHFVNWSNGAPHDTLAIQLDRDSSLVANFAIDQFTITAAPNGAAMGSVTGGGVYAYGDTATLTANPAAHCYFVRWSNFDTARTIRVAATQNDTLMAVFNAECGYGTAVTDQDGNSYNIVKIGNICWTKENIKSLHYMQDGSAVSAAAVYRTNANPNTSSNLETYGRLYSWYSAAKVPENDNDSIPVADLRGNVQGICPSGWHLPSQEEIQQLMAYTGDELKSTGTWLDNSGNDRSGFSAVAAGYYTGSCFNNMGRTAFIWTNAHTPGTNTFTTSMFSTCCSEGMSYSLNGSYKVSVRCVQD